MAKDAVDITGLLVSFNDSKHLPKAIENLNDCHEVIVLDLGSTDGSQQIVKELGARLIEHTWVPYVEAVRHFALQQPKTDWVIFLDPDLYVPAKVMTEIMNTIISHPRVGLIQLHYQNYFAGKALNRGRWGGINRHFPAALHRGRVTVSNNLHGGGIHIRDGYEVVELPPSVDFTLQHHWASDWNELRLKCERYLPHEGRARFARGMRTSHLKACARAVVITIRSLFFQGGFLEGWIGIQLSLKAGLYEWKACMSLLQEQRVHELTER